MYRVVNNSDNRYNFPGVCFWGLDILCRFLPLLIRETTFGDFSVCFSINQAPFGNEVYFTRNEFAPCGRPLSAREVIIFYTFASLAGGFILLTTPVDTYLSHIQGY